MVTELKLKVLKSIEVVFTRSKDCQLDNKLFDSLSEELSYLKSYLNISISQAIFFSVIYSLNYKSRYIDFGDLIEHFDCSPSKILEYSYDFDELYTRNIVRIKNKKRGNKTALAGKDENYEINELITQKILQGQPIPTDLAKSEVYDNIYSLLEEINSLVEQRGNEEIISQELFEKFKNILKENVSFQLIDKLRSFNNKIDDKLLFLYVVWCYLIGDRHINVHQTYNRIYDHPRQVFTRIEKFITKENNLIKDDWLELEESTYTDNARMLLSEKALDFLQECGITLINKKLDKKHNKNIISPADIPHRLLIYSEHEVNQMELLQNLLKEENFNRTQERLIEKNLPKGVAILMHGVPGTGKTESVLQIAKATQRDIMKVDISASRTAWFGESEKKIKQVFTDYKSYAKKQKLTPILFFNEADAILSKRKDSNSLVSDTENRIQNILLEELEYFDGILMATTNLAKNIDTAFERRFLFKIEFKKPSIIARTQIWKSKMSYLTNEDCQLLASQFDFSGGQIDNIARKNEINEIVHGNKVDVDGLLVLCKEETIRNQSSQSVIGFLKTRN